MQEHVQIRLRGLGYVPPTFKFKYLRGKVKVSGRFSKGLLIKAEAWGWGQELYSSFFKIRFPTFTLRFIRIIVVKLVKALVPNKISNVYNF